MTTTRRGGGLGHSGFRGGGKKWIKEDWGGQKLHFFADVICTLPPAKYLTRVQLWNELCSTYVSNVTVVYRVI